MMTMPRVVIIVVASVAVTVGVTLARANATPREATPAPQVSADSVALVIAAEMPTHVTMRNVAFHIGDGVLLRIAALDGAMRSVKRGIVDFDDKTSYELTIDSGEITLTTADLTNLLNKYVFAYPGAPLKHLKVSVRGAELGLTGTLRKGVDIPFDLTSTVALTGDQKLRLHPTKMRILGVDGAKLMSALGLSLQKMVNLSKAKGVAVQGNDLILAPLLVLPPPVIRGRIVAIRVSPDGLQQTFGRSGDDGGSRVARSLPDSAAQNYMLYRGGTLHFGKLYMTNAEMLVIDEDPSDPFDFDNDHYQRQLVAGHSRTLPSLGLEVYMPDASKLGKSGNRVRAGTE
jgi:hypothetical protein